MTTRLRTRLHRALSSAAGVMAFGALSAASLSGCADKPATAMVVAVSSEPDVPEEIDAIEMRVTRSGKTTFYRWYTLVDGQTTTVRLPGSLALQLNEDEKPGDPIRVDVVALTKDKEVALRSATLGFSEEKTKLLRMPLRYSCYEFEGICGDDETCKGGRCEKNALDVNILPTVDLSAVIFPTKDQGGCFDASDAGCLKDRSTVLDVAAFKGANCEYDASQATGFDKDKLNVAVLWAKAIDQGHVTPLNMDPVEGWIAVDGKPGVFRLAPGLCDAVKNGKIKKVEFNFACETKRDNMPVCAPPPGLKKKLNVNDSACNQCVYAPAACQTQLDAAKAANANDPNSPDKSQALVNCAFACPYDGKIDTKDECTANANCISKCLDPAVNCTPGSGAGDKSCDLYTAARAWIDCLNMQQNWQTRCQTECTAEGSIPTCQ